jgi:hypothetical protein
MADDEERPRPLSWKDLAAREEAGLAFPGSRLVQEMQYDEGEGWGFDNVQKTAMLQRTFTVDADADDVQDWYRTQLALRGWEVKGGHEWTPETLGADFYALGSAHLTVRVSGREADRPWWTKYWPKILRDAKGLLYDITLSDGESPPGN